MEIEPGFKKEIDREANEEIEKRKEQLRIKLIPYIDKEIAEIADAEIPLHLVHAKEKELKEKNPSASKFEAQWRADAIRSIKNEMFDKRLEEEIEKRLQN